MEHRRLYAWALLLFASSRFGSTTALGQSSAQPSGPVPVTLPQVMRFCGPAHCANLSWNNGHYDAVYDDTPGTSTYTVELFSAEAVRIIRHDKGGGTAVLTGRISPQGNSILDGKATWTSGATGTYPFTLNWGTALQTVPGNDQDKSDAMSRNSLLPVCNDEGRTPADSERALAIGNEAAKARSESLAMACFLLAAQQGDASAQVDVAYAYQNGIVVSPNRAEALKWYRLAANSGNTYAQSELTAFGDPVDKAEADQWNVRMWELRNQHSQVCSSLRVRDSISKIELNSVRDPAGVVLGVFGQAFTGVDVDMKDARPELVRSSGTDLLQSYGRFQIDMGMQTGDFLCKATFIRGHLKNCDYDDPKQPGISVCAEDDAGIDTKLTEAAAKKILDTHPSFIEIFRIRPLADGRYLITLVPTSVQLTNTYSDVTASP